MAYNPASDYSQQVTVSPLARAKSIGNDNALAIYYEVWYGYQETGLTRDRKDTLVDAQAMFAEFSQTDMPYVILKEVRWQNGNEVFRTISRK